MHAEAGLIRVSFTTCCTAKSSVKAAPHWRPQGVRIFSEILNFFERWNSWGGWGIFIGMFIGNVTLFLPSVALILGAGFVFGSPPPPAAAISGQRSDRRDMGRH